MLARLAETSADSSLTLNCIVLLNKRSELWPATFCGFLCCQYRCQVLQTQTNISRFPAEYCLGATGLQIFGVYKLSTTTCILLNKLCYSSWKDFWILGQTRHLSMPADCRIFWIHSTLWFLIKTWWALHSMKIYKILQKVLVSSLVIFYFLSFASLTKSVKDQESLCIRMYYHCRVRPGLDGASPAWWFEPSCMGTLFCSVLHFVLLCSGTCVYFMLLPIHWAGWNWIAGWTAA